ncbi:MAG: ribonuclease III [Candidatus Korobacteraceae bacterium]
MKHLPLDNLEEALGHQFANRALLEQALTHSSFARESSEPATDNEQMEFLGDAVLQLVASQELYRRFPAYQEGELSKLRAHLVNAQHLVHCALHLQLGSYLRLGRGEEKTGGRRKTALLSDAVEALLAALYLDGGMVPARAFVLSHILEPELDRLSGASGVVLVADHKSRLQELLRAAGRPEPRYEMIGEEGPAHHKSFTMRVIVADAANQELFATLGSGSTKKAASQVAAQKALERLQSGHHE